MVIKFRFKIIFYSLLVRISTTEFIKYLRLAFNNEVQIRMKISISLGMSFKNIGLA